MNLHRQALANVFEYATRSDTCALPLNPVRGAEKRREDYSKPTVTFTAEQVGGAGASGSRGAGTATPSDQPLGAETCGGAGKSRRPGCRALRRRRVRRASAGRVAEPSAGNTSGSMIGTLLVTAGMSAGIDTSTKSGKWRAVPLTSRHVRRTRPAESARDVHGPGRLRVLFSGWVGRSTSQRFVGATRALALAAGLPALPFHHLRHTFATLAIRGLDPATVQSLLGHSKITTTERYLHARPLTELADRMGCDLRDRAARQRSARLVRLRQLPDRLLKLGPKEPPASTELAAGK